MISKGSNNYIKSYIDYTSFGGRSAIHAN